MRALCVVLSNGVVGAEKQALALAQAVGLPFARRCVTPSAAGAALPTRVQLALMSLVGGQALGLPAFEPPHPRLAISCGRGSIPASVALREASRGRTLTVHVQRPPCVGAFDLVVAPRHDFEGEQPPPNVLLTDGSLHSIDDRSLNDARDAWAPSLAPLLRPRLAVLVGGPTSRRWWQRDLAPPLSDAVACGLVGSAAAAAGALGGSLLVSTSRRSPPAARAALEDELSRSATPTWLWSADGAVGRGIGPPGDGARSSGPGGENPYIGFLAGADYLLVSADSINMVSEACATGKPVYVWQPEATSGRFRAFHRRMSERGLVRRWPDDGVLEPAALWSAPAPPDDTHVAATRIREMLREQAAEQALQFDDS